VIARVQLVVEDSSIRAVELEHREVGAGAREVNAAVEISARAGSGEESRVLAK